MKEIESLMWKRESGNVRMNEPEMCSDVIPEHKCRQEITDVETEMW